MRLNKFSRHYASVRTHYDNEKYNSFEDGDREEAIKLRTGHRRQLSTRKSWSIRSQKHSPTAPASNA